jgi:hypothetical protein
MSKPDWENFAKAVLADWPTGDLEGSVLFDLALQYGMIQEVPGGYNSDHHFDADGVCPEEGDPWYEYTFRGEAGPGLYSISALTAKLAECLERNALLEARLGKAVEALRFGVDLIEGDSIGHEWKKGQADFRRMARAIIAEIEGEKV